MNNSRIISSNQSGIHDQLEQVVKRHLDSEFLRPIAAHSLKAFEEANDRVQQHSGDVILDSYCGVGESTATLGERYPEALVIGIDKSLHRLGKHDQEYRSSSASNYILLQADVDDFWRLALKAQWQLSRHFLLYPNPWPKKAHLKRRIHGSPLFPTLIALGGSIEIRSNWRLYVEELQSALTFAGQSASYNIYAEQKPITPFERKYQASGQTLWQLRCQLSAHN